MTVDISTNWCPQCGKPYYRAKDLTAFIPLCEGHPANASGSLNLDSPAPNLISSGGWNYYEIAYVDELQKACDELIKECDALCDHWEKTIHERDELIKERDKLKADLEKAKIEIIERDMTTDWADDAIDERDRLKDELRRTRILSESRLKFAAEMMDKLNRLDGMINLLVKQREEARVWARKFYKQIMESEDDIFFIARMLRNYEAYKQYIAKLSGDA